MLDRIIRASLRRRGLVLWAAVALVVGAALLLPHVPLDVFPELNVPTVTIMTEAPGYAPEEVERAVTFPVETAVNGLAGVRLVRSTSAVGLSIVWVELDLDADLQRARQRIGERLNSVREALPDNVHPPEITPETSITGEVMLLALSASERGASPLELRRAAEFDLRTRLLSVSGVAQVHALGGELPELQVRVRPDDLLRFGLTLDDVARAAKAAHAPVGGGISPTWRAVNCPSAPAPVRRDRRMWRAPSSESGAVRPSRSIGSPTWSKPARPGAGPLRSAVGRP